MVANNLIHLQQAQHNERVANEAQSESPDWAVTKYFYAALHYVEAYAVSHSVIIPKLYKDENISYHEMREKYVNKISAENNWEDFAIAYRKLYKLSKKARYLQNINTTAEQYFKNNKREVDSCIEALEEVKSKVNNPGLNSQLKAIERPKKPVDKPRNP